jgi:trigger factor
MAIPAEIHQVSDSTLQAEIDNILSGYTHSEQVMDRAVADGDTVNIDYVGSIDGVEFDGGNTNGAGTEVTIGVTEYIDDFLQQLIGHNPGETINVEVTFPDDYGEETLQGKDAVFVTTINSIIGEPVSAELTDEFVQENLTAQYGWTSVAEMKEKMRSDIRKQSIEQYLMEYFTTEVVIKSIPDPLIDYQVGVMMFFYQDYAEYYGIELTELLTSEGLNSVDELIERYNEYNTKNAKYYLVLQAIAEDAGISVSEEDITGYFTENFGTADYSAQAEQYGLPYIKQSILCSKVIDFLVENADMQ